MPSVVAVPPGDAIAVCPGAVKRPTAGEGDVAYDPQFDPDATVIEALQRGIVEGGQGGRLVPLDGGAATNLGAPFALTTDVVAAEPKRLEAYSTQTEPALATGAVFQHLADGDLRGVAATPCIAPSTEAWIVAGSTEPGSSARLVLVNAGLTNVTASLELWDAAGPVEAVGLTGLVIPPLTQRAVLLEGFVGDAARLASHVTASGGELAVFLQHSRLEGLVQGGTELAVAGEAPAYEVVVPGLSLTGSDYDAPRASALRVLNPGAAPANVTVELWGPDGVTTLPGLEEAVVGAGLVTDLSLAGLPAGVYTAVLTSDQLVVAAGLVLRTAEPEAPEEFAWAASARGAERAFLALPSSDLTAQLVLGAGEAASVSVVPIGMNATAGEAVIIELEGGQSRALDLAELGGDDSTVALELTWTGGAARAAALTVVAQDPEGQMISVVVPSGRWAQPTELPVYPR
ncbi:MAG: DUF5719 family protein [Bifidobacteriaceae bacterium]|jgi:hypothetical protein|nr:DUF5719 family protein [Bifidobacteriaceae bacterium]